MIETSSFIKPTTPVGRYFLYAIGEITLIVIGILIALQINNWNQNQALRAKEIKILKVFHSGLNEAIIEFESSLALHNRALNAIEIIQDQLDQDMPYQDSLKYLFFNTTLTWGSSDLDNGPFETLKSLGLDLISNENIRDTLTLIYDEHDDWITEYEDRYEDLILNTGRSLSSSRFVDYWNGESKNDIIVGEMEPLDFDKLKTDQEYLYHLRTQKNLLKWLIFDPIERTMALVQIAIKNIDKELVRLEGE